MFGQTGRLGSIGGSRALRLLAAAYISPRLTFSRAQASGAVATGLAMDGTTWTSYAADVPRFVSPANGLLIGGQRTNRVRNPRGEGVTVGTIGSGGAMPTNYSLNAGGLAVDIVATGTTNGVSWVRYRAYGTSTSTALIITFDTTFAIPASASQTWSGSWFYRLVDAPLPPLSHFTRISSRDSGGAALANGSVAFTPTATFQRFDRAQALSSSGSTAYVTFAYSTSNTTGAAYDWTFEIGWPQIELGAFASTPMLPVVGTPAASTRGADLVTATLTSLSIPATGACTLLWSGVMAQTAPAGSNQTFFETGDGTFNNRVAVAVSANSANIVGYRAAAGAFVATGTVGTMAANVDLRVGQTITGSGGYSISVNGGAVVTGSGAPTSGLNQLRLGSAATGTAALFGLTASTLLLPPMSADALRRWVGRISL